MRQILNIKTNAIEIVDDQVACDKIASGEAVPNIETMDEDLSDLEFGKAVPAPEAK